MTAQVPHSFDAEVVKLLLRIAWSDDTVSKREKRLIVGAARSWGVPEPELQALMARLESGEELPAPNFEVLRTRPDDVLVAARALALADGRVFRGERLLLEKLRHML